MQRSIWKRLRNKGANGVKVLAFSVQIMRGRMNTDVPQEVLRNCYYKIIDIVRKYNKPIRYFAYASATKCAEQVVAEDRKG